MTTKIGFQLRHQIQKEANMPLDSWTSSLAVAQQTGSNKAGRRATSIQQLPFDHRPAPAGTLRLFVKAVPKPDPTDPEGKRMITPLVYQDYDVALPIPDEDFIPVEYTPTIAQAIKDGDLEKQGKVFLDLPEEGKQPRARHTRAAHQPTHHRAEPTSGPPKG